MNKINDADLICIFGMSYGTTDKRWWEAVTNKLLKGKMVILFKHDPQAKKYNPNQGPQIRAHKDKIKQKFLASAGIEESVTDELKKNIFVALNTDMFKLNININKTPVR